MADRRRVHVTHDTSGWKVAREGAARASARCDTKAEAVQRGRDLAKGDAGQLLIHGKNGRIQEERTYRNDPYPPRG